MDGQNIGTPIRTPTDPRLLLLSPADTVFVTRERIPSGVELMVEGRPVRLAAGLGIGHKLARRAMAPGDPVLKYGAPIGVATAVIAPGEHVHVHNVRSDYTPTYHLAGQDDAR
jgi:hypothetical protein